MGVIILLLTWILGMVSYHVFNRWIKHAVFNYIYVYGKPRGKQLLNQKPRFCANAVVNNDAFVLLVPQYDEIEGDLHLQSVSIISHEAHNSDEALEKILKQGYQKVETNNLIMKNSG